jgi:hypothetical protein
MWKHNIESIAAAFRSRLTLAEIAILASLLLLSSVLRYGA